MKLLRLVVLLLLAGALGACGGGSKSGAGVGTDPDASTVLSLTIALKAASGSHTQHLSVGQIATVEVTVKQTVTAQGPTGPYTSVRPAPGVTVAVDATGGELAPPSGSVLTDNDGVARVTLMAGDVAGAFSVSASANAANTTGATGALAYSIDHTLETGVALDILSPTGAPVTRLEPGKVYTIKVTATRTPTDLGGGSGEPVPAAGVEVTVASDGGVFDPTDGTQLTDDDGIARVLFRANLTHGVFQMTATATIDGNTAETSATYEIDVPELELGSGTPFRPGVLELNQPHIGAGGTTTVTGRLLETDGTPFTVPVEILFSSACADNGAATISSPVLATGGSVEALYTAGPGCYGQDVITAAAQLPGATVPVTAGATIEIDPPFAAGVHFVSLEHSVIVTHGHGTASVPESTRVEFVVTDPLGNPVPNEPVVFALTNPGAGATLHPDTNFTGPDGHVQTLLESGTATGVTAVIAILPNAQVSGISAPITISSGFPVQSAVSPSATQLNIEAYEIDGVTDTLTVRLADRDGNPVPDGTAVRLSTDGGQINPNCLTVDGACSTVLTSSNPRPANGRVAILATTIGEETFVDTNANGQYDLHEAFGDLPEAFRDDNENGAHDTGEYFQDGNGNGVYDGVNHLYDGPDCVSGCGDATATIRANFLIVFSTSHARIGFSTDAGTGFSPPPPVGTHPGQTTPIRVLVSDLNGNMMAPGTTVALTVTNATIEGDSSFTIEDTNARGPFAIAVGITGDDDADTGVLTVTVTSPGGTITTASTTINNTDQNTAALVPSAIAVNPRTIALAPGETRTIPLYVTLAGEGVRRTAVPGIVPYVRCTDQPGGIHAEVDGKIGASRLNGVASLRLTLTAPDIAAAAPASCRVSAGALFDTFEATAR